MVELNNSKFASFDELFGITEQEKKDASEIEISKIVPFHNHPFQVRDDESMSELVASIKKNGILTPVLLRKLSGNKYEIVSGHRRIFAAQQAGMNTVPAVVRDINPDDATIYMIDSNIQRQKLLPSEKAFALKLKAEILKKRASKGDGKITEIIGAENNMSGREVQRYLTLTSLIPDLLNMVDNNKLNVMVGADIACFPTATQKYIKTRIAGGAKLGKKQAEALRKLFKEQNSLSNSDIDAAMSEPGRAEKKSVFSDNIMSFFPHNANVDEVEKIIINLLKKYQKM